MKRLRKHEDSMKRVEGNTQLWCVWCCILAVDAVPTNTTGQHPALLPMQATFLEGSGTLSLPYASSRVDATTRQLAAHSLFRAKVLHSAEVARLFKNYFGPHGDIPP